MTKPKSKLTPKLKTQKPVPVLFKPIKADFKDLFKALAKAVGHTTLRCLNPSRAARHQHVFDCSVHRRFVNWMARASMTDQCRKSLRHNASELHRGTLPGVVSSDVDIGEAKVPADIVALETAFH